MKHHIQPYFLILLLTRLREFWCSSEHDLSKVRSAFIEKVIVITKGRKI